MILTVTGHRPNKIHNDLYNIDSALSKSYIDFFEQYIINYYTDNLVPLTCRSGMALGIDTLFAIAVLRANRIYHNITLECCIPCANHSSKWLQSSVDTYNRILKYAHKITFVSKSNYTPSCMQQRNIYMVNGADLILAIWDGTSGGTANCVNYAKLRGTPISIVNPRTINESV